MDLIIRTLRDYLKEELRAANIQHTTAAVGTEEVVFHFRIKSALNKWDRRSGKHWPLSYLESVGIRLEPTHITVRAKHYPAGSCLILEHLHDQQCPEKCLAYLLAHWEEATSLAAQQYHACDLEIGYPEGPSCHRSGEHTLDFSPTSCLITLRILVIRAEGYEVRRYVFDVPLPDDSAREQLSNEIDSMFQTLDSYSVRHDRHGPGCRLLEADLDELRTGTSLLATILSEEDPQPERQ